MEINNQIALKLQELEKINTNIQVLEDKRKNLRQEILSIMKTSNITETYIDSANQKYKLKWTKTTKVDYNEEILIKRLGRKILSIMKVDYNKFKKHENLEQFFPENVMLQIGTVNKDLVKNEVTKGNLDIKDFAGAFTREDKEIIFITSMKDNKTGDY